MSRYCSQQYDGKEYIFTLYYKTRNDRLHVKKLLYYISIVFYTLFLYRIISGKIICLLLVQSIWFYKASSRSADQTDYY